MPWPAGARCCCTGQRGCTAPGRWWRGTCWRRARAWPAACARLKRSRGCPPIRAIGLCWNSWPGGWGINRMTDTVFIGIDPTAGKKPMNYSVLDGELRALVLEATGGLMEVRSAVQAYPAAVVAVDAPQSLNSGLMASAEYRARLEPPPAPGRWMGYKVCEYLLRQRGIGLYATPADEAAAPVWMQ